MNRASKVFKRVSDLLDPRQGQSKDSLLQSSTENLFGLHSINKNTEKLWGIFRGAVVNFLSPH
jgi:hypothetical protein